MPSRRQHKEQTSRRLDVIKVTIEDVNLTAPTGPMAQGRARDYGLLDIDLTQGTGGQFPNPTVGEVWWIKRGGRFWVLDHKVDATRTAADGSQGGGGGGGDSTRSGVPTNVVLGFNVREKKTNLEYRAFVTFDQVTTDADGNAANPEHYLVDWVPCTKEGNIIADEKVRQYNWSANDPDIDDPLDPAADYYVELPGQVPRPKIWYWKGRVRAVSTGGAKGAWSAWTDPVLPFRVGLPEPPAPGNVDLIFHWRDTAQQPIFAAVVKFDDVNYWDIPGFDYEDDVTEYEIQLEPLERNDSTGAIDLTGVDGHKYDRADPNNDGEPWPVRRKKVKDKDADDTYVPLGSLDQDITETETVFDVTEDGIEDPSTVPIIVQTNTNERWLVTGRTLVAGTTYSYEVYRQFNNTDFESHSMGAPLTWLKDPFRYKVQFDNIHRPRTVYWRTRVRSKDRFNRLGEWSDYTAPETPWQSIDFEVPPPVDLKADIEIHSYHTHPHLKLVARFKDAAPNGWNIPGGDLQDDLAHYVVVGEALLPDPDGYIDGTRRWNTVESFVAEDVVTYRGNNYMCILANTNQEPPNATYWQVTTVGATFRIPDRRVGVLAEDVDQAETAIDIDFDDDLPPSIKRILKDADNGRYFLRIETGGIVDTSGTIPIEIAGSEVVAITDGTVDLIGTDTVTVERAQKGSFDHGHNNGDVVYLLTEQFMRKTVHDKDEDDPGHFNNHYSVTLGRVSHPKMYYWRVKARSVDTFGHKSVWTDWTNPILPSADPDLILPYPNDISLDFDRVHKSHEVRWRAIVKWQESSYTAPDGDREVDVTRYGVQLATSDGDALNVGIDDATTTLIVDEKRTGGQAPADVPFNILIDEEVMRVTARQQANFASNTSEEDQFLGQDWDELTIESSQPINYSPYEYAPHRYIYTVVRASHDTDSTFHSTGAHIFNLPFQHHTQSAKSDKDPGDYNHSVFTRAHKNDYYKGRVRVYDRYNRVSEWSLWTLEGTPSDMEAPPAPENVLIDVDNHKVVTTWDIEVDPKDEDTDANGRIPGNEVSYFQIQLSTQSDFSTVLHYDRFVRAMSKTWRLKKPGTGTFYVRVRSIDGSGNKSAWVSDSGAQNGVPTPDAPTITFDINENTKKLRALVTTSGVTGIDDDIDGYEFQLQPAEYKRIDEPSLTSIEVGLTVTNSTNIPNTPFTAFIQHEKVHVTNVSGVTWTLTRGYHNTTNSAHRRRAKVQYFRAAGPKRRHKTGTETQVDDPVLAIFGNIQRGLWYRARVRARNTKGRWGDYSQWSGSV